MPRRLDERPSEVTCEWCQAAIVVGPVGRVPRWCSQTCNTRAYEARRRERHAAEVGAELTLHLVDRYGVADSITVERIMEMVKAGPS